MKDKNITDLSLYDITVALTEGDLTSIALVEACLKRIDKMKYLNAFNYFDKDYALSEAKLSDKRRKTAQTLSPIDGVPIAIKDNIDVVGQPTTNGLNLAWLPKQDASVVTKFKERGAIIIGKTNMHEAALGATNDNPHHGRPQNPILPNFTPGGSSGGSAVVVAAYLCPGSLGTDTMGSVRVPASYCGVVGLKPTLNWWSTRGVMPLSTTLDTVGPLGRSVKDVGILMDLETRPIELEGLVLATLNNFKHTAMQPEVNEVYKDILKDLETAGVSLIQEEISGFFPSPARRLGLLISEVEGAVAHEKLLSENPAGFSNEIKTLFIYGEQVSASRYFKSLKEVVRLGKATQDILNGVDAIISLTTPQTAFSFEDSVPVDQADFTALANFAGCPAISMPIPQPKGQAPIGLQLIGKPNEDNKLLNIAVTVEKMMGNK